MHFSFFRNAKLEWCWRLRARNGRIVAIGGEGYKRLAGAIKTARKVFEGSPLAEQMERAIAKASKQ